ncbi:hypothetical protein KC349_g255 [Hortaea werneckii]|nr:hypothetical protein KC349_g255 [Hortaea werneckii]
MSDAPRFSLPTYFRCTETEIASENIVELRDMVEWFRHPGHCLWSKKFVAERSCRTMLGLGSEAGATSPPGSGVAWQRR